MLARAVTQRRPGGRFSHAEELTTKHERRRDGDGSTDDTEYTDGEIETQRGTEAWGARRKSRDRDDSEPIESKT